MYVDTYGTYIWEVFLCGGRSHALAKIELGFEHTEEYSVSALIELK